MSTAETTFEQLEDRFRASLPVDVDYASIRFSEERGESLSVRDGVLEPVTTSLDVGVMITVWAAGRGAGLCGHLRSHPCGPRRSCGPGQKLG